MGALLDFGEHKGYGLALMCELLGGALAGGLTPRGTENERPHRRVLNGMFSVLVDPSALGARGVFEEQALAFLDWVQGSPPREGFAAVQVAGDAATVWWPAVGAGVALWLLGLVFEVVGDAQLAAYRRDPDRGPVMDRGLWAWTRHPNYFGDACVWWGLWLVGGLGSGLVPGLLTLLSPVAMTYFLVYATGARLLERTMMARPGYAEYAARTSMFLPRRPSR